MKKVDKIFQYRSFIGIPVVLFLIYLSNLKIRSFIIGITLIIAGILIRIFSGAGIYPHLRGNKFTTEPFLNKNLFSIMRHPLYIGNFLIVTGLTVSANTNIYLVLPIIIILFWIVYGLFIYREELLLKEHYGERYTRYKRNVPILPLFLLRFKMDKTPIKIGQEWSTIFISASVLIFFFIKALVCRKIF